MSEITKTRAIVLRRIDFGDTSRIAHFYTEDFGKISVMVKGARSPKSKIGAIVDTMNVVELIFYKKETRDLQLASQIDLLHHFANTRDDLDKYQYASAIVELLSVLTAENERHKKLFEGSVKMLNMIDSTMENPKLLFVKYLFFFVKEIGYEFQLDHCNFCNRDITSGEPASYNYEAGLICSDCRTERLTNFNFSEELFNLLVCLNTKKNEINYKPKDLDQIITMLEKFLSYHVFEFKGIRSLKIT
jgi:DNA repair protein RecO (recombination protein O)